MPRRICPNCKLYFPSISALNAHKKWEKNKTKVKYEVEEWISSSDEDDEPEESDDSSFPIVNLFDKFRNPFEEVGE